MQLVIIRMKNLIYWLSISLLLIFWPLSFYLANKDSFLPYVLVFGVLLTNLVLYQKGVINHYFVYLFLPLIHPAFLAFPFVAFSFKSFFSRSVGMAKVYTVIYLSLLIFVTLLATKDFYAHSIFTPDPLAFDTLNKKISLIPSRQFAKFFENKTTIFQDKLKSNVFISLDPNNYFFAHHPQEIGGNQNLIKFPYLAIIPFLVGIYYILENKQKDWIIAIFFSAVVAIAFINNQDRYDTILYLPVSLICIHGLKKMFQSASTYFWLFSAVFIPISLIELARIVLIK